MKALLERIVLLLRIKCFYSQNSTAFSPHVGDEVVHVPFAVGAHVVAVVDDVNGDSFLEREKSIKFLL